MASDDDWKKVSKLVDQFYNRADAEPFRAPVDWKGLGLTDYPKVITHPMDLGTVKKRLADKKYNNLVQVSKDVMLIWRNCQTYNQDGSDFHRLAKSLEKKWDDKFQKILAESASSRAGASSATTTTTTMTTTTTTTTTLAAAAAATTLDSVAAASGGGSKDKDTATGKDNISNSSSNSNNNNKVSLAERKQFAKSLFQLTKEDLGKLLVECEAKCPQALIRNLAEDEVELNVDLIPAPVLADLSLFVSTQKVKNPKNSTGGGNSNKRAKTTGGGIGSGSGNASGSGGGGGAPPKATAGGGTS